MSSDGFNLTGGKIYLFSQDGMQFIKGFTLNSDPTLINKSKQLVLGVHDPVPRDENEVLISSNGMIYISEGNINSNNSLLFQSLGK